MMHLIKCSIFGFLFYSLTTEVIVGVQNDYCSFGSSLCDTVSLLFCLKMSDTILYLEAWTYFFALNLNFEAFIAILWPCFRSLVSKSYIVTQNVMACLRPQVSSFLKKNSMPSQTMSHKLEWSTSFQFLYNLRN